MEVTETEHFFGTALAIQEINQSGGIRGREIEVVAYDPGSDPETYRKLADRLLTEDRISVIFGCSTSAARKAVLPAVERRNGLLWYPSLYEGFEYSPNVIYTGASPNQNSVALRRICRNYGPRFFLVGSDYIYPRNPTGSCAIWSAVRRGGRRRTLCAVKRRRTVASCREMGGGATGRVIFDGGRRRHRTSTVCITMQGSTRR